MQKLKFKGKFFYQMSEFIFIGIFKLNSNNKNYKGIDNKTLFRQLGIGITKILTHNNFILQQLLPQLFNARKSLFITNSLDKPNF